MDSTSQAQLQGKYFWESHYGQADRVWSGKVNPTLATILEPLPIGSSLDLGCGEGGDTLWLASRGWQATGVDISQTAIARAREAARHLPAGSGETEFTAADLETWEDQRVFDLVTLSFFHAPFEFQRDRILRGALQRVAPGGNLVLLSHGSHPAAAKTQTPEHEHEHEHNHQHTQGHGPNLVTVDSELKSLGVPVTGFDVLQAYTVQRTVTGPDGQPATIDDVVVMLRRTA